MFPKNRGDDIHNSADTSISYPESLVILGIQYCINSERSDGNRSILYYFQTSEVPLIKQMWYKMQSFGTQALDSSSQAHVERIDSQGKNGAKQSPSWYSLWQTD